MMADCKEQQDTQQQPVQLTQDTDEQDTQQQPVQLTQDTDEQQDLRVFIRMLISVHLYSTA